MHCRLRAARNACSQSMASVESVKAASDVYAPVSGKIVEVNTSLADSPAVVNEAAESKAWFVKIGALAAAGWRGAGW